MKYIFILITAFSFTLHISAQDSIPQTGIPRFFLDCDQCDFNYIREELPFVPFVREPGTADVHILFTSSQTGSGGHKYFLNFIGLNSFRDVNYEYEATTSQSDTDDDSRKALLRILKVGILQYYSRTSFIDNLVIDLEDSENRKADAMVVDRWNNWVFMLSSGAEFQKEESQDEYSIENEASARKITENWKTEIQAGYETNVENFYDEGERIENRQDRKEINVSVIRSLTGKWSAGLFGSYQSMTFLNIKNNFVGGAGIQYNVFPWSECNRRVLSIGYVLGSDSYQYDLETIYDRMKETHIAELLIMELDLIQPWGEINIGMQGRNYFYDFSKSRLTIEADFSVRLTKNLSVFCDIESQLIHDQLYLPKGDASLEDILLRRRKLATTYEVDGHLGLRFTFGSIFNNVVNERFKME